MEPTTEHIILLAVREADKPHNDKYAPMRELLLGMGIDVGMLRRHLKDMSRRGWIRIRPPGWERALVGQSKVEVWVFLEDLGAKELKRREREDASYGLTKSQLEDFSRMKRESSRAYKMSKTLFLIAIIGTVYKAAQWVQEQLEALPAPQEGSVHESATPLVLSSDSVAIEIESLPDTTEQQWKGKNDGG